MRVVVVSDGRRGHLNPCLAVAEQMGEVTVLSPAISTAKSLLLKALLAIIPQAWWRGKKGSRFLLRLTGIGLEAMNPPPEVVMSAGTKMAPLTVLLASSSGALAVSLTLPTLMPLKGFDFIGVTFHDDPKEPRPPGYRMLLTPARPYEKVAKEAEKWAEERGLSRSYRYIAFLIGGHTRRYRLPEKEIIAIARFLVEICEKEGWRLLLTTSRRTPRPLEEALQDFLSSQPCLAYAVWAHSSPENPVPYFLTLAEKILVTEDSFSMVSEAVSAGKFPLVLTTADSGRSEPKLLPSYHRLQEEGYLTLGGKSAVGAYLSSPCQGKKRDEASAIAHFLFSLLVRRSKLYK